MGKYIGYALLIGALLFALEWFNIVDVPFLEIPDLTKSKTEAVHKTEKAVKGID